MWCWTLSVSSRNRNSTPPDTLVLMFLLLLVQRVIFNFLFFRFHKQYLLRLVDLRVFKTTFFYQITYTFKNFEWDTVTLRRQSRAFICKNLWGYEHWSTLVSPRFVPFGAKKLYQEHSKAVYIAQLSGFSPFKISGATNGMVLPIWHDGFCTDTWVVTNSFASSKLSPKSPIFTRRLKITMDASSFVQIAESFCCLQNYMQPYRTRYVFLLLIQKLSDVIDFFAFSVGIIYHFTKVLANQRRTIVRFFTFLIVYHSKEVKHVWMAEFPSHWSSEMLFPTTKGTSWMGTRGQIIGNWRGIRFSGSVGLGKTGGKTPNDKLLAAFLPLPWSKAWRDFDSAATLGEIVASEGTPRFSLELLQMLHLSITMIVTNVTIHVHTGKRNAQYTANPLANKTPFHLV